VEQLIEISHWWASASLPADPFAQLGRRAVLRALTAALVGLVAGGRWSDLEARSGRDNNFTFAELQLMVGEETYQKTIAEAIQRRIVRWEALEPEKRAVEFAALLATFKYRMAVSRNEPRFAEFLLRLASEPATLAAWPKTEVREALDRVLPSPVLMRAARFLVLAVHMDELEDTGAPYEGWAWT
jgi:hypothetical protein